MTGTSRRAEALALLGLAQRAGAVVKGTDGVRQAIRRGEVRLVLFAEDGSRTQQEKVRPLARARDVRCATLADRGDLGAAVGSGPLATVAVTRRSFAEELEVLLGRD